MSGRLRTVLFGDGAWAALSLRRLLAEGHEVAAVVGRSRPSDAALAEAAAELRVPLHSPRRVNDPAFVQALAELRPELGLSIAYDQILRAPLRAVPRLGFVNFHAGMLPRYRGRNVVNWAILNGETEIGLTAHCVDDGIDTGDILLQRSLPIGWTDGYGDVLQRVVAAMPDVVAETVAGLACDALQAQPQSEAGTYFSGRQDGDEWLDWTDSSVNLHNKVRAINRPGPGARTLDGGSIVTIWRAYCDPTWPRYLAIPGQVVGRRPEGALVKTGDSTLLVLDVQYAGQPSEPPQWPIGKRLGLDIMAAVSALLAGRAPAPLDGLIGPAGRATVDGIGAGRREES
jgi:methionyl-tRNA formyltransferase